MGTRVYIGRLSYQAREKDVEHFFKGCGRIRDVMLKNGYGFVEFEDSRDADDAVYELNGKELCGERVLLEHARGAPRSNERRGGGGGGGYRGSFPPPRRRARGNDKYGPPARTEYRLIVEDLSSRASWQDLKDYMRQAGEVTYADAHKQHKNEGVVEFATYRDMKNALEKLDGTEINGRRIKLVEERPRSRGRKSHSRSRSRSRSRSNSLKRSRSGSRSRSRSGSRSPSRSRSRSGSRSKSRSRSRSADNKKASYSRSKTEAESKSKSRSKSPAENETGNIEKDKEGVDEQEED
ncbi:hypothetical protein ACJMK2_038127 [Sinanodonta woodiana]|uniref:Serine/arginine-rich splicing factor 5 n=1 Tax=Sinanodonta woodiana TaxID=1069815 RepID=A0ABD3WPD1_SINWO